MTIDLTTEIDAIETRIRSSQELLEDLRLIRQDRFTKLKARLENGETTGSHARDLVILSKSAFDTELEAKYRKLEERLKGHAGELILFTFTIKVVTFSRRGGPGPGQSFDETENRWGVACGVLKEDTLRLKESRVVLPICSYAIAGYGWDALLEFRLDTNPLVSRGLSSRPLAEYANETGQKYENGQLKTQILIGDTAVRDWFQREKQPEEFRKCCDLLGKFLLEPTN